LYYRKTPEKLSQVELDLYLAGLNKVSIKPSKALFKLCVFGIRFYFKKILRIDSHLIFPSVLVKSSLPQVFSRKDCKRIFFVTKNLKHRVILTLMYAAGLRVSELCNLQVSDVDFDRMIITIRQGKGNKDRCVPLAELMKKGLLEYLKVYKPSSFLFYGMAGTHNSYSVRSIQNILKNAMAIATIQKPGASLHTLRHSFATHMLEDGVNIVKIQQLMGHTSIQTTMIYTRLVNLYWGKVESPLDTLYRS
jgi:integrase/recombinase XerD